MHDDLVEKGGLFATEGGDVVEERASAGGFAPGGHVARVAADKVDVVLDLLIVSETIMTRIRTYLPIGRRLSGHKICVPH